MRTVDLSCYLIVSATLRGSGADAWCSKSSARLTMRSPSLEPGEVPVRISLTLPVALFQRPSLEASIKVPESSAGQPVISADVQSGIAEAIRAATGMDVRLTVEGPEA